jgi:hypothetical protein
MDGKSTPGEDCPLLSRKAERDITGTCSLSLGIRYLPSLDATILQRCWIAAGEPSMVLTLMSTGGSYLDCRCPRRSEGESGAETCGSSGGFGPDRQFGGPNAGRDQPVRKGLIRH